MPLEVNSYVAVQKAPDYDLHLLAEKVIMQSQQLKPALQQVGSPLSKDYSSEISPDPLLHLKAKDLSIDIVPLQPESGAQITNRSKTSDQQTAVRVSKFNSPSSSHMPEFESKGVLSKNNSKKHLNLQPTDDKFITFSALEQRSNNK